MSATTVQDPLRPVGGFQRAVGNFLVGTLVPLGLRLLRALPRNPRLGKIVVASRYDEVREVFLNDPAFHVPYAEKLNVIMGGHPFFLGMNDTQQYRDDTAAMRKVIRTSDIAARLVPAVEKIGEQIVAGARGRLEVVELVRKITFDVYRDYFGVTDPPGADLRVWATRLFEFQFVDGNNDPALRAEVNDIAPKLRNHIQSLMDKRPASGPAIDDVLGRCLDMQKNGEPGFSDDQIRSSLMGFIVGGPPQPPMVVPQAMEQLLRRPKELAGAQAAASKNDDALLAGYVFEAMRFDPLAPFMPRVAGTESSIAAGTRRAVKVPKGATVYVAFSSAMMDKRRVTDPYTFNPRRPEHEYIHFGYGLHQCFGIHMNKALLPLMLKALLRRKNLRRAPGADGKLSKRIAFADALHVTYDPI